MFGTEKPSVYGLAPKPTDHACPGGSKAPRYVNGDHGSDPKTQSAEEY